MEPKCAVWLLLDACTEDTNKRMQEKRDVNQFLMVHLVIHTEFVFELYSNF
jgi:hypothetical protein